MRIAFCIYDYVSANLPLQPWLTISRVAGHLSSQGHDVHIVTDSKGEWQMNGMPLHHVASLRGPNSAEMERVLNAIRPDCVVVLVTPLNLATTRWYRLLRNLRGIAFASYPFYRTGQISIAARHVGPAALFSYARHLMVPAKLWRKGLSDNFKTVICQSETTQKHLNTLMQECVPVRVIKPGIDRDIWRVKTDKKVVNNCSEFLYVGRASRIRGFYLALDALTHLRDQAISLKVLARGGDANALAEIDQGSA